MTGMVMISATVSTAVLLPRFGPRRLVTLGMASSAVGMVLLTRIGVDTAFASHVLPSLLILGVGLGLVFAPAMNTATAGVAAHDAGVASAFVNTMQQIGGSLGTALLSTLAASAATSFVTTNAVGRPTSAVLAHAAMHGYTTAFAVAAGIFAAGAVIAGLLYERGVKRVEAASAPVLAH
jgi:Major Facilitator Superfamily